MAEMSTYATSLDSVLADLKHRGIQLRLEGERLRYAAPEGALTDDLLAQLKACKAELMARLASEGIKIEPAVRTCPPSFVQRRFWTLQKLNPTESFYNAPFVFKLEGALNVELLRKSFNAVVSRHEVLRTTLEEIDGELMQAIAPAGEISFSFISLGDCPGELIAETAVCLLQTDVEYPFDLARQPGLRVMILQIHPREHLLQVVFHNTLFDQSSLMILLNEVSLHYAGFVDSTPVYLPPPTQYTEYVGWQESFMTSGMEERLDYWKDWFRAGEPPEWTWTPSLTAPAQPSFHTHVPWQRYSAELTKKVKELSQRNGVTVYITLLAAYATVLRRYTGCSDITIGTTYSNRHHWKFASLMGATIDVPALRIDMSGDSRFVALLSRVRAVVTAALTYQDIPFERIASKLNFRKKPSGPLFRMVFSFFPETPHKQLILPGVQVTFEEELINQVSRPDLYLVLWENKTESGEELTGYWMHKKDVFSAETAERMNREFQELLGAIVEQPDTPLTSAAYV